MSLSRVVIGYDEGTIMVKLGREEPVASMDNSGKIIWAKHNEIQTVNIKSVVADLEVRTQTLSLLHDMNFMYEMLPPAFSSYGHVITSLFTLLVRLLMEKDCLWQLRSWEHVIFTHR